MADPERDAKDEADIAEIARQIGQAFASSFRYALKPSTMTLKAMNSKWSNLAKKINDFAKERG